MSLENSHLTEMRSAPHFTQVFLDRLGNEQQEGFYARAITAALRMGRVDLIEQAQAWLDFSLRTREFERRMILAEEDLLWRVHERCR